jgi:hypothetical protein
MHDANTLIIKAIETADTITTAGRTSLLGIAARALEPDARLTREQVTEILGFHPSLVIAITVTADLAGDPISRRDLGKDLFSQLQLRTHPPQLTREGRLAVVTWCLEQLDPIADLLEGTLQQALDLARGAASAGQMPSMGALNELQGRAEALQRSEVVGIQKGERVRMGITDDDKVRRRAGQAVRALTQGMREACDSEHLCPTVAGEVAGALYEGKGLDAAASFCLGLARLLDDLPDPQVKRAPGNGS